MEKELAKKIFMINNYPNKESMENDIKEYIKKLKVQYPTAIITKEFYKVDNILVRATEIYSSANTKNNQKQKDKEIDDWYIKQRGER